MPKIQAVRTSSIAWGLFFIGTCAYCLTYQAIVWAVTPDVAHTVLLALREWGAWFAVMPLVFGALSRSVVRPDRTRYRLFVGACAIGAAALVPLTVDLVTETRSAAASLAIFLPRNLFAFLGVCLLWKVFVRREAPSGAVPALPAPSSAPELPDALLVTKGADECVVAIDRVQRVAAAGNYVEVHAAGQMYLMRATLTQLEARLPRERFVRLHRSHIVGIDEIERIRVQRSGSGVATLRDGASLPVSKHYRARLQKLRLVA